MNREQQQNYRPLTYVGQPNKTAHYCSNWKLQT